MKSFIHLGVRRGRFGRAPLNPVVWDSLPPTSTGIEVGSSAAACSLGSRLVRGTSPMSPASSSSGQKRVPRHPTATRLWRQDVCPGAILPTVVAWTIVPPEPISMDYHCSPSGWPADPEGDVKKSPPPPVVWPPPGTLQLRRLPLLPPWVVQPHLLPFPGIPAPQYAGHRGSSWPPPLSGDYPGLGGVFLHPFF
ncbi:hypothetical protein GWK47_015971 [Chionoecetes opilio]|uniref:Uncharacterized protein n=1 Tax=Chionoecetes opilio TaxID=41210 RepID=A0A8J5CI36_CHIOP|nr:hypothetical protein GWK47_015971 [Chionoecetes opilio]